MHEHPNRATKDSGDAKNPGFLIPPYYTILHKKRRNLKSLPTQFPRPGMPANLRFGSAGGTREIFAPVN